MELRNQMNIFLRPLMEEMKELWQGIDAYNSHLKCQFNLRVAYLWPIHDYLAYDKFVGWCVHGRLNCPICMANTDAFRLQRGRKVSSLIIIKYSFHQIMTLGMTHVHF
jgi:hypothetical protein